MNWTHFPDSPFGDVDICEHGNCREHNYKTESYEPICIICDYPEDANITNAYCDKCYGHTWHLDGKCIPCNK